ncbi:hypothetical protein DXG01_001141 [Tephrocybe rancida]|nr:hypothetical protein DXG01_001141 [Tephrocybe rancida]
MPSPQPFVAPKILHTAYSPHLASTFSVTGLDRAAALHEAVAAGKELVPLSADTLAASLTGRELHRARCSSRTRRSPPVSAHRLMRGWEEKEDESGEGPMTTNVARNDRRQWDSRLSRLRIIQSGVAFVRE